MEDIRSPQVERNLPRKKPYVAPRLTTYGKFIDVTQMPGGSLVGEGQSGKGHRM